MRSWYKRVVQAQGDAVIVTEALNYFEQEYQEGCAEMAALIGSRLIAAATKLPGMVGYRYEQFTELTAIIEHLQTREDAVAGVKRRHYLEHYNRALSDRMVENFTASDPEVIGWRDQRNHVAAVRGKFEALSKQYESLHYQLGHIANLRIAGLDDAIL